MSWFAILGLALATYLQKAVGPILAARWMPGPRAASLLTLLAVPVLAGLIVVQTVGDGRELTLDARLPAVLMAMVAVWRGAPFMVTVGLAAVVAAGIRAIA
ncbi:MAG: AzlD protein [Thermoleophilia bacterium]|nr:AzlD protein [Thermoleophilia bacterium]